ncbi:MAG: peptidase M22 [Clostridia bacterium]|nr:peptidase M22 [Clostridia bacterium]
MSYYLGIDTSNYTTSVALYNDADNTVINIKKLLPVKEGEKGIRQSDAVFHHTVQLPELISQLFNGNKYDIKAIGVSTKPCNENGSYMPCFLTGISVAVALSNALDIPLYRFSHQDGHIASALYSADKLNFIKEKFIAFHISGGTSQALLVNPNEDYFETIKVADSLDLKAGQAVDRVGLSLGLHFPCGPELEKLALNSTNYINKLKVFRREGQFSLSGVENQCKQMITNKIPIEDIALHCLSYIYSAIDDTVIELIEKYGDLPLVFSGGVMSNSIIRKALASKYNAYFAEPQYSSDNACGIAILSSICNKRNNK